MKINTNTPSLNAQRNLSRIEKDSDRVLQRLSSGKRINSAADDAAGLAIAARMTMQINGTNTAIRNANDGISLAQTAESALSGVGDMLQRMRELTIQSLNGTNSAADRKALQAEMNQLSSEIDRVAETTSFNGRKLFDGSGAEMRFQIGANEGDTITLKSQAKLNSLSDVNISTQDGANKALQTIDAAMEDVMSRRVDYGAVQSRFESAISSAESYSINMSESRSRIEDADYAKESAELVRVMILKRAGIASLAHANTSSQFALQLLGQPGRAQQA